MAKKRTILPFYGKANQRLETAAKSLAATGTEQGIKAAGELLDKSAKMRAAKMATAKA